MNVNIEFSLYQDFQYSNYFLDYLIFLYHMLIIDFLQFFRLIFNNRFIHTSSVNVIESIFFFPIDEFLQNHIIEYCSSNYLKYLLK